MKSYNLVLQSSVSAFDTSNETFYFEWGQITEGKYKVQFTFTSQIIALPSAYTPNIFLNLGQQSNTFIVPASTLNSPQLRGNFLGSLSSMTAHNAQQRLFADLTTNTPLYLNNRPTNNTLHVEIEQNTEPFQTPYPDIGQYTMMLCLTLLE